MNLPHLRIAPQLKSKLAAGHPWVYRDQFAPHTNLPSGTWVELEAGKWRGYALWDARSPIAARVYSSHMVPDKLWVRERIQSAWEGRAHLRTTPTSAYRLVFGEGDGLPGITVDLYNTYAVLATYADSVDVLEEWVCAALRMVVPDLRGIVRRRREGDDDAADGKVALVWGEQPPSDLIVEEYGLKLIANVYAGQKTGLFLDHRENRHTIERWSSGRSVLNCFSYTGAFSLYAARGGASRTISVDIAPAAAEDAAKNFALNGLAGPQHEFLARDCFEYLQQQAQRGQQFDLVILDPPSFARSRKNQHAALRAYAKLNALAMRCVAPGGLLATASCTSQVSPEAFRAMLGDAAATTERQLAIIHEAGHALDHPVPAHFPEGRYLKFILARVLERP